MGPPDIERVISLKSLCVPANTLTAPYDYLHLLPSNNDRIRSTFLAGINESFFRISDAAVISEISAVIEIFHGASLLIDDIEDDSAFRRGQPCAHIRYGVPATLNSGNLMYFVAMRRAFQALPPHYTHTKGGLALALVAFRSQMVDVFVEEMVNLHTGQGFDIYWRDNLAQLMKTGMPSIEDYLQVVMHKTGGLFRLAVRTLGLFAGDAFQMHSRRSEGLVELANLLGIIYQIRDDYLNLVDERYAELKGSFGEDLIEGKLSLPILYTLLHSGDNTVLHTLYDELKSPQERRADLDRLAEARCFVADSGALQYTYSLLQEYVEKARSILAAVNKPEAFSKEPKQ
ncbi:terpenoid synthase [Metschnikowia bicuspidata var. bicuspidata NRRL YB-4993]|uniref:Terpenoid synthase n=1 Tax=Metschnikowia bicuspidata var. bicuspidata NRRL YB-4993 TaxID=869754 RepID=A0A1A0H8G1_9ASCO|nr:terpenoid synthase [Metschnikowia bicuspidata var. bicuspidata NRRL YB-4993]OBA20172.1 terpenoid synthase [Metschnikowia bicuspidata var. bicuspidata NRRL YB-4993]